MSKVTIELGPEQIERIVEDLTIEQKLRLVRKLEKETLSQRWDNLLKTIDERRKKYPISQQEINKEIALARKEFYAKRRS